LANRDHGAGCYLRSQLTVEHVDLARQMSASDSQSFVLISGCSGGGKSMLLIELGRRGYATVEEPGRRIVKEEILGEATDVGKGSSPVSRRLIALRR
jgi:hypothetical protein